MSRHRRRSWVKLWTTGWLHGSIRWQLTTEERGVWADLIALAGECGQEGAIADNDGQPLPRKFIANQLNITQSLLDRVILKCVQDERLKEDELNKRLEIVNWKHYQSEYDRQKPFREKAKLEYTYEMYCQDWDEIEVKFNQGEEISEPSAQYIFFTGKYGLSKGQDYLWRSSAIHLFTRKNLDRLVADGLATDKPEGRIIDVDLMKGLLDSFRSRGKSTLGDDFPLTDYDQVMSKMKEGGD